MRGSYGFASDVWSLGLIALESATGQYPYQGAKNHFALVKLIVEGPLPTERPDVSAHLSDELRVFVNACLTKSAPMRPDSISLTRFDFLMRHLHAPVNLRALLHELKPYLEQEAGRGADDQKAMSH